MNTRQTKPDGLWKMTKGEFEESVTSLEREIRRLGGNPRQLFDMLRTDENFNHHIAKIMIYCGDVGFSEPTEIIIARMLLNENIFDVRDWMSFHVLFTEKQLCDAEKFPWDEEILNSPCPFTEGKRVKDTHFAFLGLEQIDEGRPLTVVEWYSNEQLQPHLMRNVWFTEQSYAKTKTLRFRWYLMLKGPVPDSLNKTFEEQKTLLPEEYVLPSTIEEFTKAILVFWKTGKFPLSEGQSVACTERTQTTSKTREFDKISCIGFQGGTLTVESWSGNALDFVGIGASRIQPS